MGAGVGAVVGVLLGSLVGRGVGATDQPATSKCVVYKLSVACTTVSRWTNKVT